MFFFKNHAENEAGRLVPDLFLFFKKDLYEVKASGLQLRFKGALSGLRQHLATKSPIKMIKNTFYFISKSLFAFRIFNFLS